MNAKLKSKPAFDSFVNSQPSLLPFKNAIQILEYDEMKHNEETCRALLNIPKPKPVTKRGFFSWIVNTSQVAQYSIIGLCCCMVAGISFKMWNEFSAEISFVIYLTLDDTSYNVFLF